MQHRERAGRSRPRGVGGRRSVRKETLGAEELREPFLVGMAHDAGINVQARTMERVI